MNEDFNPDELRPVPYRPDTELMLGPWQLGILFLALALLCGICYFVGYAAGKRSVHNVPVTSAQVSTTTAASGSKPTASPQTGSRTRSGADAHATSDGAVAASGFDPMASGSTGPPATAPALVLMVQIAAVSHQEDADVLVDALRKRGYAVTTRRDPADSLIHVRVGPFSDRSEANAARQKLLNDGYNALVQP